MRCLLVEVFRKDLSSMCDKKKPDFVPNMLAEQFTPCFSLSHGRMKMAVHQGEFIV